MRLIERICGAAEFIVTRVGFVRSLYIQGGKKSLSVAIADEFFTFDLIEIREKNLQNSP